MEKDLIYTLSTLLLENLKLSIKHSEALNRIKKELEIFIKELANE